MLPVPFVANGLPELRHVASVCLPVYSQHCGSGRGSYLTDAPHHFRQSLPSHPHGGRRDDPILRPRVRVERALRACRTCPPCEGARSRARPLHPGCHRRVPITLHCAERRSCGRPGPQLCPDIRPTNCPEPRTAQQVCHAPDPGSERRRHTLRSSATPALRLRWWQACTCRPNHCHARRG